MHWGVTEYEYIICIDTKTDMDSKKEYSFFLPVSDEVHVLGSCRMKKKLQGFYINVPF